MLHPFLLEISPHQLEVVGMPLQVGCFLVTVIVGELVVSVFGELKWLKYTAAPITLCCFVGQAIGREAALAACAAGLILSASKYTHCNETSLKLLVALFATVFCVLIGTGLDLAALNPFDSANYQSLIVASFLLAVAVARKVAACWSSPSSEPTNRLKVGLW